jgi:hypothetical protein
MAQARKTTQDRFLAFERKQPFGEAKLPDGPDFAGNMYNKRNQYATVYDRGFLPSSSMSGKTISQPPGSRLSNAGSSALNTNMTTY